MYIENPADKSLTRAGYALWALEEAHYRIDTVDRISNDGIDLFEHFEKAGNSIHAMGPLPPMPHTNESHLFLSFALGMNGLEWEETYTHETHPFVVYPTQYHWWTN